MIENELKYVLEHSVVDDLTGPHKFLAQGYLGPGGNARLRHTREGKTDLYEFVYKFRLPNGEMEEFEKTITKEEFNRCFPLSENRLIKQRHTFEDNGVKWDLDVFLDAERRVYFCMAECEMPSGQKKPQRLPSIIEDHLLYAVPREATKEYSSKTLSDIEVAKSLLRQIQITQKSAALNAL